MVEQGYVLPGSMVVASDSHSNLYGAMAALGTPVVRTDAASIWATGVTWWQVPPIAKVVLKGKLSPGVVGKDVIIALCGLFNKDEVLNHAVEFVGDGAKVLMDLFLALHAAGREEWFEAERVLDEFRITSCAMPSVCEPDAADIGAPFEYCVGDLVRAQVVCCADPGDPRADDDDG